MTLDTLSRLKGIETHLKSPPAFGGSPALDTLSRLKGIETPEYTPRIFPRSRTLDTLSRLKGIETNPLDLRYLSLPPFGYAFPFEGN